MNPTTLKLFAGAAVAWWLVKSVRKPRAKAALDEHLATEERLQNLGAAVNTQENRAIPERNCWSTPSRTDPTKNPFGFPVGTGLPLSGGVVSPNNWIAGQDDIREVSRVSPRFTE